jgi:hypothetical protein
LSFAGSRERACQEKKGKRLKHRSNWSETGHLMHLRFRCQLQTIVKCFVLGSVVRRSCAKLLASGRGLTTPIVAEMRSNARQCHANAPGPPRHELPDAMLWSMSGTRRREYARCAATVTRTPASPKSAPLGILGLT